MARCKTNKRQRGGRNDLSYVVPNYSIPSTSSGNNLLVPTGTIVRPSMSVIGGARTKRRQRGGCGCGLPAPIAARDISRNEPLYPAIHARLIGGRRTRKVNKKHRGGFSPAVMGPLIDNFHYIAPAVGLVAYRYWNQIKDKKHKSKRGHRRH